MNDQERLALERLNREYQRIYEKKPGTFLERLAPEAVELDLTENVLVTRFQTAKWMRNPLGCVHGGVVAAMADVSMAAMARLLAGLSLVGPTVHLDINYLRPVPLKETIYTRTVCHKAGRSLFTLSATAYTEAAPGKALFQASGSFVRKSKPEPIENNCTE